MQLVPYEEKRKGISRCYDMFPNIYFNNIKSVLTLIRALDTYHYKYDESAGCLTTQTSKDWNADLCDAFRYVCYASMRFKKVSNQTIDFAKRYKYLYN